MTRKAYLTKLIQLGRVGEALEELNTVAMDTYYEKTSILLMGQYNGLKEDSIGLISEEQRTLRTNRLLASTTSLMKDLQEEVPTKFDEEVEVDEAKLKAAPERKPSGASEEKSVTKQYNFYGNVGAVEADIKGDFIQNIDQRTVYEATKQMPLEELVEAEKQAGYITKEEYEELLDILADIKENQGEPSARQKRSWGRWLGKALEAGRKFTGERLEKGIDTGIGEVVKKWINSNGLDQLKAMIDSIVN